LLGAFGGDFLGGAPTTLGKYVTQEAAVLRFDNTWAAIFIASFIGIIFYAIIILAERWLVPWAQEGGE
jgi:NitT/TauT family transport system permease protein